MKSYLLAARLPASLLSAVLVGACAGMSEPVGELRKETLFAVTADMELVKFNAGQAQRFLSRQRISGLGAGAKLVGIDFRVARGVLYALAGN